MNTTTKIKVQAPVTIQANILVMRPDGTPGVITFACPFGQFPSEAEMREVVAQAVNHPQLPEGSRLATKREFCEYVASEMVGHEITLTETPGGEEWDA